MSTFRVRFRLSARRCQVQCFTHLPSLIWLGCLFCPQSFSRSCSSFRLARSPQASSVSHVDGAHTAATDCLVAGKRPRLLKKRNAQSAVSSPRVHRRAPLAPYRNTAVLSSLTIRAIEVALHFDAFAPENPHAVPSTVTAPRNPHADHPPPLPHSPLLLSSAIRAGSSTARAFALHAKGSGFESLPAHFRCVPCNPTDCQAPP